MMSESSQFRMLLALPDFRVQNMLPQFQRQFLGKPPGNQFYVVLLTNAKANDCCKLHFNNLKVQLNGSVQFYAKKC